MITKFKVKGSTTTIRPLDWHFASPFGHDDARRQSPNEEDRHHGDRNNTQVVGECPPHRLTDHHPQRDADDDADKG